MKSVAMVRGVLLFALPVAMAAAVGRHFRGHTMESANMRSEASVEREHSGQLTPLAVLESAVRFAKQKAAHELPPSTGGIPPLLHVVVKACSEAVVRNITALLPDGSLGFQVRCHDDTTLSAYVRDKMPFYHNFFESLPVMVMKSDIFRYMVTFLEGGFYVDDDVTLFPGFHEKVRRRNGSDVIVGWERRMPEHPLHEYDEVGQRLWNGLVQFAFGAPRGDARMKDVVDSIKEWWEEGGGAEYVGQALANSTHLDRERQVMITTHTGPVVFTTRILMHLNPEKVLGIEAFRCGRVNLPCDPADERQWLKHGFEGRWRK